MTAHRNLRSWLVAPDHRHMPFDGAEALRDGRSATIEMEIATWL